MQLGSELSLAPTAPCKLCVKDTTGPLNHPINTEIYFFFLANLLLGKGVDTLPVSCHRDPNRSSVPRTCWLNEGTKQTESWNSAKARVAGRSTEFHADTGK